MYNELTVCYLQKKEKKKKKRKERKIVPHTMYKHCNLATSPKQTSLLSGNCFWSEECLLMGDSMAVCC